MQKRVVYNRTRFSADVLRDAAGVFRKQISAYGKKNSRYMSLSVAVDGAVWKHDSEDEFFADYRRSSGNAIYNEQHQATGHQLWIQIVSDSVEVSVMAPSRAEVEAVFEVFEKHLPVSRLPTPEKPAPPPPTIFVGHGHSPLWRDLKDHLHEKHGYPVEAYEIGARAGHVVRDILEDMLQKSAFAILVMTGEDETAEGGLRARQNVIHEVGLFQGRLGFNRAIVALEEGTEEFSNIQGIHQIRFPKGRIQETYGEVLATLRREFLPSKT